MERFRRLAAVAVCLVSLIATGTSASDSRGIAGPVSADILRVVDGDTVLVLARPWPQQTVEVLVRIRGIDAPEIKATCVSTRMAVDAARTHLVQLLPAHGTIFLTNVAGDKYFGRVVADVRLEDGSNPAQEMIGAGLALPYDGGRKPTAPCRIDQ